MQSNLAIKFLISQYSNTKYQAIFGRSLYVALEFYELYFHQIDRALIVSHKMAGTPDIVDQTCAPMQLHRNNISMKTFALRTSAWLNNNPFVIMASQQSFLL